MDGIRQLRIARGHLEAEEGTPRDRLRSAARAFWWATSDSDGWPPGLRDRAGAILPRLFTAGVMTPEVETMDGRAVGALAAAIVALCDEAESAAGWPPHLSVRRCAGSSEDAARAGGPVRGPTADSERRIMGKPGDAAAGSCRSDDPFDVSPAATRRRDERTAALSFLDAAIAGLEPDAAVRARALSEDEARKGGTP